MRRDLQMARSIGVSADDAFRPAVHAPEVHRPEAHTPCVVERWHGGDVECIVDSLAEEVPVALVYNGIAHAVMLATPDAIEDFAIGFSLSEGIVARPGEILDLEVMPGERGIEVQMTLPAERAFALRSRRRSLAGRTGCGLCGIESLEHAIASCRQVGSALSVASGALERAQREILASQPLFALTGAVHAAAWCRCDGSLALIREDVGRHNALDKLIGALAVQRTDFSAGFVLMTSRASYEIVQKAASVGIELLAAISAPTGMAVRVADASGVSLVGFVRGERYSVYTHPQRVRRVH